MEGNSSWRSKEQSGDSLASDWRSQLEPGLREKVILAIVEKLKEFFPERNANVINRTATTFEDKIYDMAKDKGDYMRRIREKLLALNIKLRTGSSANVSHHTPEPAQDLNQGQSQSSIRQQWFPQNNIQRNLNIPDSSGLPTQAPMTVSAAQNLNIQMGEGVHSSLLPGPQRQIQGRQQFLPQTPHHQQQQSLLKQPIQQHLPHHTSLSTNQQSFPQAFPLSSLPSSGQQNSQFPTKRVHSIHQQQMVVPSQEHHISQVMNGQDTQQTRITSRQIKVEPQQAFRVSTSQQNNMASLSHQPMMLQQYQPNNPVQQPQNRLLQQHLDDIQRFQAAGSLHQSQNLADQQNQQYQLHRSHPENPSTSQDSTGKTMNTSGGDWREETYQKIKALKEKHVLVLTTTLQKLSDKLRQIDAFPQHKIPHEQLKKLRHAKAMLEQVLVFLNVHRNSVTENHRDKFSFFEEHVLRFTPRAKQQQQQAHLPPSQINQTSLQYQSGHVHVSQTAMPRIETTDENKNMSSSENVVVHSLKQSPPSNPQEVVHSNIGPAQSSMQRQQQHKQPQRNQQQQLQIPEEMNDARMRQRVNIKAEYLSWTQQQLPRTLASPARVPDLSPSDSSPQMQNSSSPQLVEQQPLPTPLNKTSAQEDPLSTLPPEPITERPIDRLIRAIQSSSQESLAQSVSDMSSVISLTDRFAGSVHSTGGYKARIAEDLSERTRFRVQQGDTNPTKRFKRSFTAMPRDITPHTDSYKQFCSSRVNKTEPSCALLQEIIEINGRLVETVVNICNEDLSPSEVTSGTVVICCYAPVALSATFKALYYKSGHISQIQPLRLLVPENYPHSPIILDKALFDAASEHKNEDLSARAMSRFGLSMGKYSEAMSLKEIAKVWDECARATMVEYAERHGGGTFSSKYGRWESVLRAS